MKKDFIEGYYIDEMQAEFTGAYVFEGSYRNFLLNKQGYSILVDNEVLEDVRNKDIRDNLAVTLVQHRFLKLANSEPCFNEVNDIHPVYFMIDMTNRCNMLCKYCLREGEDSENSKSMSKEAAKKICDYILQYCRENNEDQITIQPWGGEPLLEKEKIFLIQDYLIENGITPCISIETNGLLLNDELIDELHQRNIWTSVSIDGPKFIHDNQRVLQNGKPTHSYVEKNLIKLRDKFDGRVSVIATLTKESYKYVNEVIHYLVCDLHLANVKLNFVHKSSFVDNDYLCMAEAEIAETTKEIFHAILELEKNGYRVGDYNIHTKLSNLITNRKTDVCMCDGCHGGRRMIVFDYKGDIYPCDVTDYEEEKIGNIDSGEGLVELVSEAMKHNNYFIEKREEKCNTCPWYCYCKGGCTVHVKTQNENPPKTDMIECSVNQMLYPLLVEQILEHPDNVNLLLQSEVL